MRGALGAVEHDLCPDRTGRGHHSADVGQGAGHVRAMRERDEPTPRGELAGEPIEIEPPLRRHGQEPQNDAASLGQPLPGHQIAVVLEKIESRISSPGCSSRPKECASRLIEEVVP